MTGPTGASLPASRDPATRDAFVADALLDAFEAGQLAGADIPSGDCALLLDLLHDLGWRPDARRLIEALPHFPQGLSIGDIRSTLARLGYPSVERRCRGLALAGSARPGLAVDAAGVVARVSSGGRTPVLHRPASSEAAAQSCPVDPRATYRHVEFEPHPVERNPLPDATESCSRWVLSRFSRDIRFLFATSFLATGVSVAAAFGVIAIFDQVLPSGSSTTALAFAIGFSALFVLEFFVRQIGGTTIARISARLEYLFGTINLGKVLKLPAGMVASTPVAAQLSRLRQFQAIRDYPSGPFAQAVLEIPPLVMIVVVIALLSWQLALVIAGIVAVFAVAVLLILPPLKVQLQRLSRAQSAAFAVHQQIVAERLQIMRLSMADEWIARGRRAALRLAAQRRAYARYANALNAISLSLSPIATAVTIGIGATLVIDGRLSAGQLIAVSILTWRVFAVVRQVASQVPRFDDIRRVLRQIDGLQRLPQEREARHDPIDGDLWSAGHIRAQTLTYRHPRSIMPVIANAGFEIPLGSIVAITGPSGAGKSTLLRLFSGTLEPQGGGLFLNEVNVGQLPMDLRTRYFGFVSQRPLLFYGTVAQNLRFADPLATEHAMREALAELGLDAWLDDLPEGLESRIDPSRHAGLLRADVRTNFAIARALLAGPKVLLLDEPAGGLSPDLEARMIAAIERRRGSVTTMIVTHRPSLARRADAILHVENGQVRQRRPEARQEMRQAS